MGAIILDTLAIWRKELSDIIKGEVHILEAKYLGGSYLKNFLVQSLKQ
jgi:hypothetical protein